MDEILAKRAKKGKKVEEKPAEEKTIMHCKGLLPVSCSFGLGIARKKIMSPSVQMAL